MKKDALGKLIILGNSYGYSRSENGVTYVRIGKIVKETQQNVTLKVEIAKKAIYSNEFESERLEKEHISIKSNMLFPVEQ